VRLRAFGQHAADSLSGAINVDTKQTRIVILVAMIFGVLIFALVNHFGPITGLPKGAGGFVVVLMALAALRYRKPPATLP